MEKPINTEIRAADLFTTDSGAKKWDEMYSSQKVGYLEYMSRTRRDYTLAYVEANFDKKSRIFDLGCGAGPVISELNKRGYNCYASDFSRDILEKAKSRIIALSNNLPPIIQSNCEQIPLASNCMDLIVCLGVISYVPDRLKAISEMFRVLSEQGTLIITFRNSYNLIMRDPA